MKIGSSPKILAINNVTPLALFILLLIVNFLLRNNLHVAPKLFPLKVDIHPKIFININIIDTSIHVLITPINKKTYKRISSI
jgi:hypothetical protein